MTLTPESRSRQLRPGSVFDLAAHGSNPALVLDDRTITYAELDALVSERAEDLGPVRRLVMLEGANELEPVVTYLAALAGGHPVLLVPGTVGGARRRQWQRVQDAYDPDVIVSRSPEPGASGWHLDERRPGTRHELHPDLALLLGTSGSTGSPKLVRLSRDNLRANAESIAESLGITERDRAATTLPVHYCYGLSVLNSHLVRGASVWLTNRSVVDEEFWAGFDRARPTSFAGVPYTFDLLETSGFAERDLSSLRLVTQAGGAMTPDRVRAVAELGERRGFELVVMYGQTEATARMAYLPPHLTASRPSTIGIPVPGGDLRLEDGELVYTGPNVMLGYATEPADLALGRTLHELRTGDLGRQHNDGLFEIVGRCNRVAKLFGTRLDLEVVERLLDAHAVDARVIAEGNQLIVFVRSQAGLDRLTDRIVALVRDDHCLPAHAVRVVGIDRFPMTDSGKPDHAALSRHVADTVAPDASLRAMYATVLGRPDATDTDSFVTLRGDSLSFVEVSFQLERRLGVLPPDWPEQSIRELSEHRQQRRRWTTSLESAVVLRALAITLVVGSHVELFDVMGGAHVMLGLAGFNLARFQLAAVSRRDRVLRIGRALRELVVPAVLWIGGVAVVSGKYDPSTVLLMNTWFGPDTFTDQWQFWFLEVVLYASLGIAALLLVGGFDRMERRHPFATAVAVVAATLAVRYALAGVETGPLDRYALATTLWCVAIGWMSARASTRPQRLFASVVVAIAFVGYFGDARREALVVAGLIVLLWIPSVRVPRMLARPVATIAAATYFVYLTHWVVYPPLEVDHSLLALLASLVVGVVTWQAYGSLRERLRTAWWAAGTGRMSTS